MGSVVSDANSRNVRRVWAGSSEATVIFLRGGKRQCVPAIFCYSSPACTSIFHPSISDYCSANFQANPQKVKVRVPCNHFNYSRLCVGASCVRAVSSGCVGVRARLFRVRFYQNSPAEKNKVIVPSVQSRQYSSEKRKPVCYQQNWLSFLFSTPTRSYYCPASEKWCLRVFRLNFIAVKRQKCVRILRKSFPDTSEKSHICLPSVHQNQGYFSFSPIILDSREFHTSIAVLLKTCLSAPLPGNSKPTCEIKL
jgi:hypothetical protein